MAWVSACRQSGAVPPPDGPPLAPVLTGLGSHHVPITTRSPGSQRFFDQGLRLAYAFNHAEAERAFREAARLDPECAMCWWGVAYVLGPNINAPMFPEHVAPAWQAIRTATRLKPRVSAREGAYIDAMTARYAEHAPADRRPLDRAYADRMAEVAVRHPDDLDAATLHAEALLTLSPWQQWKPDGTPTPDTPAVLRVLEGVLARNADHPGAIHFYIHATEASPKPERAERYADRLATLVPGAGHLVHMPSHTYIRVGRYHDGTLANIAAMKADEAYLAACHAQGIYPAAYVPHAVHFLWATASMQGWSAKAIEAATATDAKTDHALMREPAMATLQHYTVIPLFTWTRFGRWTEILQQPAPELPYPRAIWHYARGRALVGTGRLDDAARALQALEAAATDEVIGAITLWDINPARTLLRIGSGVLGGELLARRGDVPGAVRRLREAVALEDGLRYNEPPDWHYPVRHSLGAVLLEAGRAREAEQVYRDDLERNRENGWALFGLMRSLEAQRRSAEAGAIRARFDKAWAHADVVLKASRF
jgi:tetratricopeptide (TPR) repeat protein